MLAHHGGPVFERRVQRVRESAVGVRRAGQLHVTHHLREGLRGAAGHLLAGDDTSVHLTGGYAANQPCLFSENTLALMQYVIDSSTASKKLNLNNPTQETQCGE